MRWPSCLRPRDCDCLRKRIRAEPAPIHARYANPVMLLDGLPIDGANVGPLQRATLWTFDKILRALGLQGTGGSTSTRNIAGPIRAASASALDLLTRAAADRFNTPSGQIEDRRRYDRRSRRQERNLWRTRHRGGQDSRRATSSFRHWQLANMLARARPASTSRRRFMVSPASASIPVRAGQLYAAIRHSPRIGGALARASLPANIAGVRGLVEGRDYLAIVADSYALAAAALEKADIVWDESKGLKLSTKDVFASYRAALDKGADYKPRWVIDAAGDIGKASGRTIKATYDAPFLAHATMEPINATALVTETSVKVWAGHQSASLVQLLAARRGRSAQRRGRSVHALSRRRLRAAGRSRLYRQGSRDREEVQGNADPDDLVARRGYSRRRLSSWRHGRRRRDARFQRPTNEFRVSHRRSIRDRPVRRARDALGEGRADGRSLDGRRRAVSFLWTAQSQHRESDCRCRCARRLLAFGRLQPQLFLRRELHRRTGGGGGRETAGLPRETAGCGRRIRACETRCCRAGAYEPSRPC